jgi:HD superfamily phosphohydrolase
VKDFKFIRDTVHGSVKVSGLALELMDSPEFQRLRGIRQMGLANLVYPGANHTRFEHSFGTSVVAEKMARSLELDEDDTRLLTIACLLHDIGHGPFSHTLEMVTHEMLGIDHMEVTKRVIRGKYDILYDEEGDLGRIPRLLERYGLKPDEVSSLMTGVHEPGLDLFIVPNEPKRRQKRYLPMLVHGTADADQMDYLLRDAHHTGVAYGIIDLERILNTLVIYKDRIAVHRKGITAIEGMLVARALMYSAVYMHKTVRIAELMLARAVERAIASEGSRGINRMMDDQLVSWLEGIEGHPSDTVRRLRRRVLYKSAYVVSPDELTDDMKGSLLPLCDPARRREIESDICRKARAPEGSVILDIPMKELLISEPRIARTDMLVWDEGKVVPFSKVSTLSAALRNREVMNWAVMVSSPPKHREAVAKSAKRILS